MRRDEGCKNCQCNVCTFDYGDSIGYMSMLCKYCYGEGTTCRVCKNHSHFVDKNNPDCEMFETEDDKNEKD